MGRPNLKENIWIQEALVHLSPIVLSSQPVSFFVLLNLSSHQRNVNELKRLLIKYRVDGGVCFKYSGQTVLSSNLNEIFKQLESPLSKI